MPRFFTSTVPNRLSFSGRWPEYYKNAAGFFEIVSCRDGETPPSMDNNGNIAYIDPKKCLVDTNGFILMPDGTQKRQNW